MEKGKSYEALKSFDSMTSFVLRVDMMKTKWRWNSSFLFSQNAINLSAGRLKILLKFNFSTQNNAMFLRLRIFYLYEIYMKYLHY